MSTRISRRTACGLLIGGCVASVQAARSLAAASGGKWSDGLPRVRPEAEGLDPRLVLAFLADAEATGLELHSFMLARRGNVVAEGWWSPYRADRPHMMHSLTKSVTACAVGLAVEEGRFRLTDPVTSFFPEELPASVSDNLRAMTIENLLSMRTGHDHMVSGAAWRGIQTSWVAEFFKIPVVEKPGTRWVYTSAATYMLSAIISKTTGQSTQDYLRPRMFDPLGIHDEEWLPGPQGITPGANGLSWRTADSLKLGILHAQRGLWRGRRVLPAVWVDAVQQPHGGDEYGYQWWRGPDGAYFAAGLFGQFSVVFPKAEAVLAITGAVQEKGPLDPMEALIWRHFPRALADSRPAHTEVPYQELRSTTSKVVLLKPIAWTTSPLTARVSGKRFVMEPNEDQVTAITLTFESHRCVFTLVDAIGSHAVYCGIGRWLEGDTTLPGSKLHHEYRPDVMRVVAGGRWVDTKTFEMTWQFVETAFRDTATCRFNDDTMTFDRSVNVNSAALSRPTLLGRI